MRVVCFLAVFVLAGYAFGQEDPRDAERQFRFLLSRGEELHAQADNPDTGSLSEAQLRTLQRRLENEYRHFLNDHPRHTRAMVAYGSLLYDQGREEEAVDWWKKAIAIDPREAYAYNSIAGHYGHDGHAADALKLYDKAIELEPTEPIFRFNWATTCVMFRNESHAVYGWTKEEIFQHSLEQFRKGARPCPAKLRVGERLRRDILHDAQTGLAGSLCGLEVLFESAGQRLATTIGLHPSRACVHAIGALRRGERVGVKAYESGAGLSAPLARTTDCRSQQSGRQIVWNEFTYDRGAGRRREMTVIEAGPMIAPASTKQIIAKAP